MITDSYWLDVVEASSRVPGAGAAIPEHSHWGRWSFPLPASSDDAFERGERLARTAMQLRWTQAAKDRAVTILTPPEAVRGFVASHPGLMDACVEWPSLLVEDAPQSSFAGFEGDSDEAIEAGYQDSCRRAEATRRGSQRSALHSRLTTSRQHATKNGRCGIPIFRTVRASDGRECLFCRGIFGPEVSPYEQADHLFWLLSADSSWLPERIHSFLKDGMAEWAVWHWPERGNDGWRNEGAPFAQLWDCRRARSSAFIWTTVAEDDSMHRIDRSITTLGLPESPQLIRDRFVADQFAERYLLASARRKVRRATPTRSSAGRGRRGRRQDTRR